MLRLACTLTVDILTCATWCACCVLAAVGNLTHPLAIAARNAFMRSVVALNGTLPSDWLWKYDCQAVVEAEGG